MNPIHFQFVTSLPNMYNYTLNRLFNLCDGFDVNHRDFILMPAYLCFDFAVDEETDRKSGMYRSFKRVFKENASQFVSEDSISDREAYAVYGLVSQVLVNAVWRSGSGAYESLRPNIQPQMREFDQGITGDDSARQRAMEWSAKAFKQLELVMYSKLNQKTAYRLFCEQIVQRLLSGADEEDEDDSTS